ncbi:methyl-accepting chemotaxis protein [Cytobacillus solani]|uniref:methyl-accepting chemotaxis protein n=1 Tax=Cytobacillus solani TaxID=1637975 RepID=UPI0012E10BD0|nr:methyl-accepting chemotaxis protein [Cytobacillus solani]
MNIVLYLMGTAFGVGLLTFAFALNGELYSSDISTYLLLFSLAVIVLFFQQKIMGKLEADLGKMQTSAEEKLENESKHRIILEENSQIIASNMQMVEEQSESEKQMTIELNVALQEIASGTQSQGNAITNIMNSIERTAKQVDSMNERVLQINESTDQMTGQIEEGRSQSQIMNDQMQEFKRFIELMEKDMNQLSENIESSLSSIQAIQGITAQTICLL